MSAENVVKFVVIPALVGVAARRLIKVLQDNV